MVSTGLVSITFRNKVPEEIIRAVSENGLDCIEWGADIHCKPKDRQNAENIRAMTEKAGIRNISYGSYLYCGTDAFSPENLSEVSSAADILDAPNIRVWAGNTASSVCDGSLRKRTVCDIRKCCDVAKQTGKTVSLEFHPNTLTDDADSAVRLIDEVERDNLRLYFQPNYKWSEDHNIEAFEKVFPFLLNVHVFSWNGEITERYPLIHSRNMFRYIAGRLSADDREHCMLLEFVFEDDINQLYADSRTLKEITAPA